MNKKNLALLMLVSWGSTLCAFAQKKPSEVILQGQIKSKSQKTFLEDMSAFEYLLPVNPDHIITLDTAGRFAVHIPLQKPGYYRIVRNILYLTPGDSLNMLIDWVYPEKSEITGKGMEANNYLRYTPFPKAGSYAMAGCREMPGETIASFQAMRASRDSALQQLQHVSAEFKRLEAARNKADLILSLKVGAVMCAGRLKLKKEQASAFVEVYNESIASLIKEYSQNFLDTSLMKLVVYRDIAEGLLPFNNQSPTAIQTIKDYYQATKLVDDMKKLRDKQTIAAFSKQIDSLHTPGYRKAVHIMQAKQMSFVDGDNAVDLIAEDSSGKQVKLSDFKGKVVYVDFWATWCMPCMAEMPYLKKLKEAFKDNSNVVFLSVSIDDDKQQWKKSLVKNNFSGQQWIINRNLLTAYKVTSIPRMLLIDQQFRMADINAGLPSDAETEKTIQMLLQKQ